MNNIKLIEQIALNDHVYFTVSFEHLGELRELYLRLPQAEELAVKKVELLDPIFLEELYLTRGLFTRKNRWVIEKSEYEIYTRKRELGNEIQ
ncbi:TPA: hypothetical protein U1384_001904 [Streptococcus suis]|nr:hypothetical protein [Streptococcus suis]